MTKHWKAEKNSLFKRGGGRLWETAGVILRYDPTPGGQRNADGTTSYSITFPALILSAMVSDGETVAARIAQQLNTYPALLDALKALAIESGGKAIPNMSLTAAREQALAIIAAAEAEPGALS